MKKLRYLGWEGYAEGTFSTILRRDTGLEIDGENHLSDDRACRTVLTRPEAWDILNINTPFVRDVLNPRGLIHPLSRKFTSDVKSTSGVFERFKATAESALGDVIGIPQRCGPFNLVINQNRLSPTVARQLGFGLALQRDFRRRFGILAYEDFNVMHIAIAAGLNPFTTFDDGAISIFTDTARTIFRAAQKVSSDHTVLNKALVDGEIDFYISGGTYTASSARLAGRHEVRAISPEKGPISGKGAVAFVEINALIKHHTPPDPAGEAFLSYITSNSGAVAASLAAGACNPVVQMHRASVFDHFTTEHLSAMQWDDFERDMSLCADYAIMPDYEKLLKILSNAPRL